MATAYITSNPGRELVASFFHYLEMRRETRARRAVYNQTFRELSALTRRELDDIGVARSDISDIAREAADLVR